MLKKMASLAVITTMITTLSLGTFANEVATDSTTGTPVPATAITEPIVQPAPTPAPVAQPAPVVQPAPTVIKATPIQKTKQNQNTNQQQLLKLQQQLLLQQQQQQKLKQQQIEKLKEQKLKLQQQNNVAAPVVQQPIVQQPIVNQPAVVADEPLVEFDLTGMLAPTVETPLDELQSLDMTEAGKVNKNKLQFDQKDKQALKKMEGQLKGLNNFKIVPVENIISPNGTFKADAPMVIEDKTILMPLTVIDKAFGTKIQYIKSDKKFVLQKGKVLIEIFVNKAVAEVNGKPVKVDAKPIMINNRVLLPVNIISKSLEMKVKYDAKTNTLIITPKESTVAPVIVPTLPTVPVLPTDGVKAPVTDLPVTPEVIPAPVPTPAPAPVAPVVPETPVTPQQ